MSQEQNLSQFNRFLINNHQFLLDKHQQYFPKVSIISKLNVQALVDYIFDIFSLNKYKRDRKVHDKITNSLSINIQQFIADNISRHAMPFDAPTAIQALTYCIQHNDMFSVQYDIDSPQSNNKVQEPTSEVQPEEVQNNGQPQKQNNHNQEGNKQTNNNTITKTMSNKNLSNNPQQIYVNITKLEQNIQRRQNGIQIRQSSQGSSYKEMHHLQPNQFDQHHERMIINLNKDILKKNARIAYFNFCKNQMELGGNQTFDRLSEQASTMTVGKLLVYAKAYNMMNDKINKQLIMHKFKKISDGKRTIDFQRFYILLNEFQMVDGELFDRLQLMDQKLQKKLKFVKYPFYTQDQNPRQLVVHRSFVKKLTSHSGKTHQDLKDQLITRKSTQFMDYSRNINKILNRSLFKERMTPLKQKQRFLSPKDLSTGSKTRDYSIDLSFIDKIISPEETDMKYLGDYEIQHLTRLTEDNNMRSNNSIKRKDSIVENIKKRIQQIQNGEKQVVMNRMVNKRQRYKIGH